MNLTVITEDYSGYKIYFDKDYKHFKFQKIGANLDDTDWGHNYEDVTKKIDKRISYLAREKAKPYKMPFKAIVRSRYDQNYDITHYVYTGINRNTGQPKITEAHSGKKIEYRKTYFVFFAKQDTPDEELVVIRDLLNERDTVQARINDAVKAAHVWDQRLNRRGYNFYSGRSTVEQAERVNRQVAESLGCTDQLEDKSES